MQAIKAQPMNRTSRPAEKRRVKKIRRDERGRRIYTAADLKKMDKFILPPEPEWEAEWERRTGQKAQP